MIQFEKFSLQNGLRVIVHTDKSTPMAVVNVIYDVGSRDEDPAQTGFAHLFEHLMFGGSINIPEYDEPLQKAGGENNAFTSNDVTNYYCQLPAENIETAFWLESDRMLSLAFSKKSLEVQRKVVCEEFKEHYINKPYGDVWHKMRELAFTTHPLSLDDHWQRIKTCGRCHTGRCKAFFFKHYRPCNAVLVVAGNISSERVKELAEKWFGPIPAGEPYLRNLPQEPIQTAARKATVKANVPLDALYKCWHIYPRTDKRYYVVDLITEILSGGGSSRCTSHW
jgi:predicted Zn-dependent peptidase